MSAALTKQQAARQIWLLYFNRTLLERGIISEKEHNQMKVKIQSESGGCRHPIGPPWAAR